MLIFVEKKIKTRKNSVTLRLVPFPCLFYNVWWHLGCSFSRIWSSFAISVAARACWVDHSASQLVWPGSLCPWLRGSSRHCPSVAARPNSFFYGSVKKLIKMFEKYFWDGVEKKIEKKKHSKLLRKWRKNDSKRTIAWDRWWSCAMTRWYCLVVFVSALTPWSWLIPILKVAVAESDFAPSVDRWSSDGLDIE